MVCKKCGAKLEENATVCSKCNTSVDEDLIHITYENEDTDYITPPVITEAHTFIDEDSFAKKINDASEEEEEVSSKNPMIWVFIFLLVAIIGGGVYFGFFANLNPNKTNTTNNTFTTESWTSGEAMIDGDFYHLPQPYSAFYNKNFDLSSIESITNVNAGETTDLVLLTSSFDSKHSLLVHLTNHDDKPLKFDECNVTGLMVNNNEGNNTIDFTLPGQITKGSKDLEIQSIYGKLEDTNITYDDVLQATTYHYVEGSKNLELIVFDNGGLKSFHYYISRSE